MTNDERNPKPECRKALSSAVAGFVLRVSSLFRISSFVIRIYPERFMARLIRTFRARWVHELRPAGRRRLAARVAWFGSIMVLPLTAQETSQFAPIQPLASREMRLQFNAPAGLNYRVEVSTNLLQWESLLTLSSSGLNQHTDSATPYFASRIYRAFKLDGTNILTGDHLATDNGDVIFHPINHATLIMSWSGK